MGVSFRCGHGAGSGSKQCSSDVNPRYLAANLRSARDAWSTYPAVDGGLVLTRPRLRPMYLPRQRPSRYANSEKTAACTRRTERQEVHWSQSPAAASCGLREFLLHPLLTTQHSAESHRVKPGEAGHCHRAHRLVLASRVLDKPGTSFSGTPPCAFGAPPRAVIVKALWCAPVRELPNTSA